MASGGYSISPNAGGAGTVTSVGLSMPSIFAVSGSPVTTTGTLTATLVVQNANKVFAGPSTGADAAPTFRVLVAADIPDLSAIYAALAADNVFTSTGFLQIPKGTTAQQPGSPATGMMRYNSTTGRFEFYTGSAWSNFVRLDGDTMTGTLTVPTVAVTSSVTLLDTTQKTAIDVSSANTLRVGNGFTNLLIPGIINFSQTTLATGGSAAVPGYGFIGSSNYGLGLNSSQLQFIINGVSKVQISNTNINVASGMNFGFGTSGAGSKIGDSATNKISIYGVTPIVQPAGANQQALTDSTTGTASFTLVDVGVVFSQANVNNNFASVARLLNQLRSDMVSFGSIKGSA
jgi:hypothetical protein